MTRPEAALIAGQIIALTLRVPRELLLEMKAQPDFRIDPQIDALLAFRAALGGETTAEFCPRCGAANPVGSETCGDCGLKLLGDDTL
jgi:ribosomal protein L40E